MSIQCSTTLMTIHVTPCKRNYSTRIIQIINSFIVMMMLCADGMHVQFIKCIIWWIVNIDYIKNYQLNIHEVISLLRNRFDISSFLCYHIETECSWMDLMPIIHWMISSANRRRKIQINPNITKKLKSKTIHT